ncbi:hypothetical protein KC339_g109 [Hortaea werneckii]|nr:hypothetical protein KC339_g109 [Hortaea werneckii]
MRYLKFDIAARQRGRPAQTERWADIAWTVVPLIALPTITYVAWMASTGLYIDVATAHSSGVLGLPER